MMDPPVEEFQSKRSKLKSCLRKLRPIHFIIAFVYLSLVGAVAYFFAQPRILAAICSWIEKQKYWGNLVVVGLFVIVAMPFALSGYTFLCLACGLIYRFYVGALTAFVANVVGLTVSYWLNKLGRRYIDKYIEDNRTLRVLMKTLQKHSLKIAFLFRFTPIPYGLQNALFSISGMSFRAFMLAALGLIPEQLMWVYWGSTARELNDILDHKQSWGTWKIIMFVGEVVIVITLCIVIVFIARRTLKRALEEQKQLDIEERGLLTRNASSSSLSDDAGIEPMEISNL